MTRHHKIKPRPDGTYFPPVTANNSGNEHSIKTLSSESTM